MSGSIFIDFVKHGKKILGVTTNYTSMLRVLNKNRPAKPTIFMKPTTSYITEGQCIKIPNGFSVNQEIELGVVINQTCRNVKESAAMEVVAGYCVALDLTATCQMKEARGKGLPWLFGKGFDTACPVSTFIRRDEIDPYNTQLWCCVNGSSRQEGNTCELVFTIPALIAFITQHVTLEECDLILTGTPPGIGEIVPGDVVEGGIKNVVSFKFKVTK